MRKLASIQKIKEIVSIEGADSIELAIVNGWQVVVGKNQELKPGDFVVYCEIDSFLPIVPEFEFLRKSSYKKMADSSEGFRLKTAKFRGQISQGLIISLNDAYSVIKKINPNNILVYSEGLDVTEILGILKYEPPVPACLAGISKGLFPGFIPKTDEERVQNLTESYSEWRKIKSGFYITEKLDGSSSTFYYRDGEFGVCSRNLELLESEDNTLWSVARKIKLEEKLARLGKNIALQGELIGEGIQGNPYKMKGQSIKFFNIFDIDKHEYYGLSLFLSTIENELQLETVPVLEYNFNLPDTVGDLLKMAEGKSILNKEAEREGLVIRSTDRKISFKAISNKFLLNEKN